MSHIPLPPPKSNLKSMRKPMTEKVIPKEVVHRAKSIRLMLLSLPFLIFPGIELYNRLALGKERKIQIGEILEDGTLREFGELEKLEKDKQTWGTWLFGEK
ncbi:hypothetical protein PACTADRAFT_848 [Pachysolen tannophilus NRRL Y-2460]|uniref:Uncharacterized protein n=1 Tax=Pachysolen tannophilus NRRL Y-2460 TaxID=669874 RepID=A0A1E4U306_PACTA|nr:hypothetical protein PACTADRAFT_848 [Pachysolen tannophilus NRRL Y-2460]